MYRRLFRCVMGQDDIEAAEGFYDVITICGCFSIPVNTKVFQVLLLLKLLFCRDCLKRLVRAALTTLETQQISTVEFDPFFW